MSDELLWLIFSTTGGVIGGILGPWLAFHTAGF